MLCYANLLTAVTIPTGLIYSLLLKHETICPSLSPSPLPSALNKELKVSALPSLLWEREKIKYSCPTLIMSEVVIQEEANEAY